MAQIQQSAGWRKKLFSILDPAGRDENGRRFNLYDIFIFACVALSLLPLFFKQETNTFITIDRTTAKIFIADYFLRWICADFIRPNSGRKAFTLYPFTPMAIIDLLAIIPSVILMSSAFQGLKAFRIMYVLRVLKVTRVLKAWRYSKSLQMIQEVLRRSKNELLAVCALAIGYIIVSALLVFNVEPDTFSTYFDAFYWAAISLTTVGYGDLYPVSVAGRCVAMLSSFLGIAIVALPAAIITAEFMTVLNNPDSDQDSEKQ